MYHLSPIIYLSSIIYHLCIMYLLSIIWLSYPSNSMISHLFVCHLSIWLSIIYLRIYLKVLCNQHSIYVCLDRWSFGDLTDLNGDIDSVIQTLEFPSVRSPNISLASDNFSGNSGRLQIVEDKGCLPITPCPATIAHECLASLQGLCVNPPTGMESGCVLTPLTGLLHT